MVAVQRLWVVIFCFLFCCGEGCGGLKMTTNTWIPLPTERGGSVFSSLESAWAYD